MERQTDPDEFSENVRLPHGRYESNLGAKKRLIENEVEPEIFYIGDKTILTNRDGKTIAGPIIRIDCKEGRFIVNNQSYNVIDFEGMTLKNNHRKVPYLEVYRKQ
ncbi:MAG: hypothetical protein AABW50_02160 [Nanoarchaeota archaeon]